MNQTNQRARWMLVASAVIFGTMSLFTRQIAVSTGELALYRAVLASLVLVLYLVIRRQKIDFRAIKKEVPLLFLSGAIMGFNWIFLFEAYNRTTISNATLSTYFAPVIVTAASTLLFHEKLTRKQAFCFAMSTLGMVLIIGVSKLEAEGGHLVGILFGLGAAVLYATVILMNKFIQNVPGIPRALLQLAAAATVLLPYVAFTGGFHLEVLDGVGWACLLTLGFFHTGITYCMYFTALRDLKGQEAAILSYIDPLVAVLISLFLLHESMTPLQVMGGFLILGFTIWNEM